MFTKLGMCIDIMEIWYGLANGQISSIFDRVISQYKIVAVYYRFTFLMSLRKHACSNILKFLPPKYENFQMKNSDNFHISAQNIDCGDSLELPCRGGSNKSPQSMF